MSKPDPTLPGVLAWARYTPIVPAGSGEQINWLSEGIGTGPYQLVEFVPNDRVVYTCNENYWKAGVPCIKDLTLKVLPDEQSRVAALRSGEIDGGTLTADVAHTLENDESLQILEGLFAAPRVIQFNTTQDVPWRDARVRQAINLAIDRQEIIDNVYGGSAALTGAIAPGYGEWPLSEDQLRELYTPNLEQAVALMKEAGFESGFDVTLEAIAAPRDYTQIAEIVRERLKPLNINVTVQPLEIPAPSPRTSATARFSGRRPVAACAATRAASSSTFAPAQRITSNGSATAGRTTSMTPCTTRRWQRQTRWTPRGVSAHPADHCRGSAEPLHRPAHQVPGGQDAGRREVVSNTDFNTGLRNACVTG